MAKRIEIPYSQKMLNEWFSYDYQNGVIKWKSRRRSEFKREGNYMRFVHEHLGKIAGVVSKDGYRSIMLENRMYLASRLIWIMVYGHLDKEKDVIHLNKKPDDLRLSNLRLVSQSINRSVHANDQNSNCNRRGVCYSRSKRKFVAYGCRDNKKVFLGVRSTFKEAEALRIEYEQSLPTID